MNSRQRKLLYLFAAIATLLLLFPPHVYGPRGVGHQFVLSSGEGTQVAAIPLLGLLVCLVAIFTALFFASAGPEQVARPGVRTLLQKACGGTIRVVHGTAALITAVALYSLVRTGMQHEGDAQLQTAQASSQEIWGAKDPLAPNQASAPLGQPGNYFDRFDRKPWEREWSSVRQQGLPEGAASAPSNWYESAPLASSQAASEPQSQHLSQSEVSGASVTKTAKEPGPMAWFIVSLFMIPITVAIRFLNKRVIPEGWRSEALFKANRWWTL
jgi:hypothetical protein